MRTNGDGGERFLARFTAEDGASDGDDAEAPKPVDRPAARTLVDATPAGSKAPKSRVKKSKSRAPKSVAPPAAPPTPQVAAPSKAPPAAKRAKSKSIAPESRRSRRPPAAKALAAPSVAPSAPPVSAPPVSAPPSLHPRTTLRDHPVQKSVANAARAAAPSKRDDEASIPPTSSDPPGELDDRFFAEGEAAAHAAQVAHAESLRATRHSAGAGPLPIDDIDTRSPVVLVPPERRKKLANYVKAAVGFSAVLLLAGFVRVGLSHVTHSSDVGAGERSAAAAQVVVAAPPAPPPVEPAVAPVAPPPVAVEEPVVPVPEEPVAPAKSAKQEKEDARAALEHGKRKDAIDAAQRSVDLDATDAEAWLILGSAQQDSGHWKDARESFVQCTKQAKVGPINECGMMLR